MWPTRSTLKDLNLRKCYVLLSEAHVFKGLGSPNRNAQYVLFDYQMIFCLYTNQQA